eukprot:gene17209-23710_t
MALETVNRTDDARKIYGKLASVCWSQKIRRQSLSLISGLDITKQIRQDNGPRKPVIDPLNMKAISDGLELGLRNEWNDFKKDKQFSRVDMYKPWYDDGEKIKKNGYNITTIRSAYMILIQEINPLIEIPNDILLKSFRKISYSNLSDIIEFTKDMIIENRQLNIANKNIDIRLNTPSYTDRNLVQLDNIVNGTWDLIASLYDKSSSKPKRFETGQLRRVYNIKNNEFIESFPVLWGLNTANIYGNVYYNQTINELIIKSNNFNKSPAPKHPQQQLTDQNSIELKVIYCDDILMITKQFPSNNNSNNNNNNNNNWLFNSLSNSNNNDNNRGLFSLWKRKKDLGSYYHVELCE